MRCYNLATARQHLHQVTALILDAQQLGALPPEIGQMPRLETLDLRNNALKILPPSLQELKSLRNLLLGNNQLQQLPVLPPNLVQIDLNGNRFSRFPTPLSQLEQLQILNFGSNRLKSCPDFIFPSLKTLNLSGNKIASFLLNSTFFPKLEKLDLSHNRLIGLDLQGTFAALDTLNLSYNLLTHFLPIYSAVPFLRHLNLSSNQLKSLPPDIVSCPWLKTLQLAKNQFKTLPDNFDSMARLEELDLSANALEHLLQIPTSLRKLNLAYNRIDQVPRHFFQQNMLKQLDLSYNPLQHLHQLEQASNLTRLNLKGIALKVLANDLLALPAATQLSGNKQEPDSNVLLNFIRACQRKMVPVAERRWLWQAYTKQSDLKNLSPKEIFVGLNLGITPFQEQLRQYLLRNKAPQNIEKSLGIAIIGRSTQSKEVLKNRLKQMGFQLLAPQKCKLWVLAQAPYPESLSFTSEILWWDERDLEQFLGAELPVFEQEEQENMVQLLLHADPVHVQLAVDLMRHHGVPQAVLPYIYLVWRWTKPEKLRRELRGLLERFWPSAHQDWLRNREKVDRNMSAAAIEARVKEISNLLNGG